MMSKKGMDIGDELEHMSDPMRHMLAMQAMHEGKPFAAHLMGRPGGPIPYGGGSMLMGGDANSSKVGKSSNSVVMKIHVNRLKSSTISLADH